MPRFGYVENPDGTFRTEIDLDNSDGRLRPGKAVRVTIILDQRRDALSIPATARFVTSDGSWCYRIVNGRAVRTQLQLGMQNDNRVEVLRGLQEGDAVVAVSSSKVRDGQQVKVKQPGKRKKRTG